MRKHYLHHCILCVIFSIFFLNYGMGQSIRTIDQARTICQEFLFQEQSRPPQYTTPDGRKSASISNVTGLVLGETKQLEDEKGAIIAYIQDLKPQGFIIISAKSNIVPVLGFSFSHSLSINETSNHPLYDLIKWDIEARDKNEKTTVVQSNRKGTLAEIGPWLKTTWSQSSHWNNYCPYNIQNVPLLRRPVGCVATALAQIVNYWEYPKAFNFNQTEYIYISGEKVNINNASGWGIPSSSELQYAMSNMSYDNDNEEALLSFASGVKLRMNYMIGASGANTYSVRDVLNKQFGFGSAVAYTKASGVWDEHSSNIIEDLQNARPVQIAIHNSKRNNGGHSIVVDGWRDDGYFHLNFGWGPNLPAPINETWYNMPTDMPSYDVVHTVVYRIEKYLGWHQFGSDQKNSFRAIYPAPNNRPERKWQVSVPEELADMVPTYSFDHLIVGTGGRIYASLGPNITGSRYHPYIAIYDKFGTLENLIEVTHSNVDIPYLSQNSSGQIFFTSGTGGQTATDSRVYELNPKTNEIRPIFSHRSPDAGIVEGPIKIDQDDNLYFAVEPRYAANYTIFYSTTKNGTVRWSYSFPTSATFYTSIAAIDEKKNIVYLNYFQKTDGSRGLSHLIAFNCNDGTIVFDKPLPTSTHSESKAAHAPSISDNGLIYIDADDVLFAINQNTGEVVWEREFSWRGTNPIPSNGSEGELYVTYNDKVMSLNPMNGATIWEKSYSLGSSDYIGEIYSARNKIVIISYDKDGVSYLDGIRDFGSTYENRWSIVAGRKVAFGSGSTILSISPGLENSIMVVSDQGERGDPEGLGMDYLDNKPPSEPMNPFPENGTIIQDPSNVTLSWTGQDPDGHSLKYDVFVYTSLEGEEGSFSPVATQINGNSYTLTDLVSGTHYLWTVVATDGQAITEGPVWSFSTECEPPAQPGSITGSTSVCQGSSQTYSIEAVSGATSYTWTLPSGWSGSSTTTSITATAGASGGTISVTANSSCGTSTSRTLSVSVTAIPSQPGAISGETNVTTGQSYTYSIGAVSGATSYSWTIPSGWSGSSTTTSITVVADAHGGDISVTANNNCGSSSPRTLAVSTCDPPAQPGSITGSTSVCQGSSQTYSIEAVSGATSYTWTLPSGWSGSSTTTSITTTAGASGGTISVTANSSCGTSTSRTLSVSVTAIPSHPGAISGETNVTTGQSYTYSIGAVSEATSYTWTLPFGWSGSSTSTSITATAGAAGSISVTANNSCGSSSPSILNINLIINCTVPEITIKWDDVLICSNIDNKFLSYQWFNGTIPIPGANEQYYVTSKQPGIYRVETIDINDCREMSNEITVTGSKSLTVYPNPAKSSFTVSIIDQPVGKVNLRIINSTGMKIMDIETEKADIEFLKEIPADDLEEGFYIVQVIIDQTYLYNSKILVIK